ncbi:HPP family protein [Salinadaptatus halalkaliphilus]|uniref:HPP family protein n=1 Tax=Salinadaptatus halalkaliphilus TaxID=2419781 RepID=UPI001FE4BA96|nr:HPP family protein [Salinadaptatus halalkaliphilus]
MGQPFLFPSLGPSAYLMATGEQPRAEGAYHVVGGHAIATVCGLVAYLTIADGLLVVDAFDQGNVTVSRSRRKSPGWSSARSSRWS